MAKVIEISAPQGSLKRRFRRHLKNLGFQKTADGMLEITGSRKVVVRSLHAGQRSPCPEQAVHKSGHDIEPSKIFLVLQRVRSDTVESRIFRLAAAPEVADQAVRDFATLPVWRVPPSLILLAVRRSIESRVSFWDAVVAETAIDAGATVILTEHFYDG